MFRPRESERHIFLWCLTFILWPFSLSLPSSHEVTRMHSLGCVPSAAVTVSTPRGGGACSGGCLLKGRWLLQGGVPAPGGCGIPACTEPDLLPPVNRMTERCKNTTFATSFWTVNRPWRTCYIPAVNWLRRRWRQVCWRRRRRTRSSVSCWRKIHLQA